MIKEENNKNNLKGTVLMVLEENDKFSKNNLISRINQRDQELNLVLLQIMRMKSLFQWQNNILKEAKINSWIKNAQKKIHHDPYIKFYSNRFP